jgi:hypothetical protein
MTPYDKTLCNKSIGNSAAAGHVTEFPKEDHTRNHTQKHLQRPNPYQYVNLHLHDAQSKNSPRHDNANRHLHDYLKNNKQDSARNQWTTTLAAWSFGNYLVESEGHLKTKTKDSASDL